jgi:hypothetical protein
MYITTLAGSELPSDWFEGDSGYHFAVFTCNVIKADYKRKVYATRGYETSSNRASFSGLVYGAGSNGTHLWCLTCDYRPGYDRPNALWVARSGYLNYLIKLSVL